MKNVKICIKNGMKNVKMSVINEKCRLGDE